MACIVARSGFYVTSVDVDDRRIATINAGKSPIGGNEPGLAELIAEGVASGRLVATMDYSKLGDAHIVILCIDTPVEPDTHLPAYRGLRTALASLGPVLQDGALVIIELTLAPGTMTGVIIPELEQTSGKRAGHDFYVGHCPERMMPGLLLHNLTAMNRTVGGQTIEIAQIMVAFYRHFCHRRSGSY